MPNLSLFSQIVTLLDRSIFRKIVTKKHADKHAKGYNAWSQLITMLFHHFSKCQSLRDISNGLRSAMGNLNHQGITSAPSKSNLAYQNQHRNWSIFRSYYYQLKRTLGQQGQGWGKKLHIKSKVYLLDSSTVTLCLSLFDWAKYTHEKGALKLHTLLDYEDCIPAFIDITTGAVADNSAAYGIPVATGSIVVADRGYMDFELFHDWDSKGVFFVVRHRDDIKFDSIEEFDLPDEDQHILKDEMVEMCRIETWRKYPKHIRRVVVWDEKRQDTIELFTNNTQLPARDIGELYRNRWLVEVFFKEIKQLLRVKTFIGTSQNAVLIQLWTAMIAILLLKYLKARSQFGLLLSNLTFFIRLNLLVKLDMREWLNNPFPRPAPSAGALKQGVLF